jgi:lipoprotein-anchoring transpeptidase ErfK/SrfK
MFFGDVAPTQQSRTHSLLECKCFANQRAGTSTVSAKREWPDWNPTPDELRRFPNLPKHMPGGEDNPLGARAVYLGATLYRIHGTNEPWKIGTAVSSGCIRMANEDVIDLYDRAKIGAKVIVRR